MTQPLALVFYEKLLPGTQLVNRLQDMRYRVLAITDADALLTCAQQEKPLLILADLVSADHDICGIIKELRGTRTTQHIPVIAFADEKAVELQSAAQNAGAVLVVGETAILNHLPQLLEQALRVE